MSELDLLTNRALDAMHQSITTSVPIRTVRQAMARGLLVPHFQPIASLRDGHVMAHEALIRGPAGTALQSPVALFAAAKKEDASIELEQHCVAAGLKHWATHGLGSRLFLNISASAIVALMERMTLSGALIALRDANIAPASLVVELTEHELVDDFDALMSTADQLRAQGVQFALDDFGRGHSNLCLWAELRPEIVKIDKYFVSGASRSAVKLQTLKGLVRYAEAFGTTLVAEGIETAEDLRTVRDIGIDLGQGYYLGRPAPLPAPVVPSDAGAVISSVEIAVLPQAPRAVSAEFTVEKLVRVVPPVSPEQTVDEAVRHFAADESLRAIAVVLNLRPVGLLSRDDFLNQYAKPFFKELYGRRSCLEFASTAPLVLDKHTGLNGLARVLTSADQAYLREGFIVTEAGRYLGLGTGEQLVRVVTEVRLEAARHANPLTLLPGNIPISEHINRLLESSADFVACYCDLNDFKPFNDHYGYWRGDEMICLVAKTIMGNVDPRRDFVGHVGGDDFVVLFQSSDWLERCEGIVAAFNSNTRTLFDQEAIDRGGIIAEDRTGTERFFPFTTLSIGAVRAGGRRFRRADEVATAAAVAKHKAKTSALGMFVEPLASFANQSD